MYPSIILCFLVRPIVSSYFLTDPPFIYQLELNTMASLTLALMSISGSRAVPRAVNVEWHALLTVGAIGIVLTAAHQLLLQPLTRALHTLTRMAVTLTPDQQIMNNRFVLV